MKNLLKSFWEWLCFMFALIIALLVVSFLSAPFSPSRKVMEQEIRDEIEEEMDQALMDAWDEGYIEGYIDASEGREAVIDMPGDK